MLRLMGRAGLPKAGEAPGEAAREEAPVVPPAIPQRHEVDQGPAMFEEGTFRVPVRGEAVVVNRRVVLAAEVVVRKQRTTERRFVSDTVRRERAQADSSLHAATQATGKRIHWPPTH
jgi:stress response protein YsnF